VQRRSWAELDDRVRRVAHYLRDEAGLRPGDHLALLMGTCVEGVELLVAGIAAGLWVTPINWHLTPDEVAYVVRDSGARLLVSDARFAETAGAVHGSVLRIGSGFERALAAASDAPLPADGPAGGNMIYTSGTTGRPKGVKRARAASLGAMLDGWRAYGRKVGLDGSGAHLVTGPLYHAAPLMFAVYDQVSGAPLHLLPRFEAQACLDALREREIAHTHLVPTMFVRLLRLPEEVRRDFAAPRLDLVLHGAAPVSVTVKRRMIEWWGPVLVEYWGATEGGVTTLVDSETWLAHPGTVGRAIPPFEVFAVDEAGRRLAPGEVGLLYARHGDDPRPFEYHDDPAKTAEAYLEPGVFTIGDVGSVAEDGFVVLADRRANTIIAGGVNIYPAEVEQVLQEHPAVADVGVFGIPDEEWGEQVKAALELRPGIEASPELEAKILAFARQRLAAYKVPRSIDFEDGLPRDSTGKLYVRRLRDPYWAGRAAKI
jgi:acyl-CoA synthetase (AMP-forming)/AMP-acid ligase II